MRAACQRACRCFQLSSLGSVRTDSAAASRQKHLARLRLAALARGIPLQNVTRASHQGDVKSVSSQNEYQV